MTKHVLCYLLIENDVIIQDGASHRDTPTH